MYSQVLLFSISRFFSFRCFFHVPTDAVAVAVAVAEFVSRRSPEMILAHMSYHTYIAGLIGNAFSFGFYLSAGN